MIVFYAQFLLARYALKWAVRLVRWTVTAVVLVAAAPVTVVTAATVTAAWLRGWPPARLRRAAAWSAPMTAAWLTARAIAARSLPAVLAAPYQGWRAGWHAFSLGDTLQAFALSAPAAVPAGLLIAPWAWGVRIYRSRPAWPGRRRRRRSSSTSGSGPARPGRPGAGTGRPATSR